MPIVWNEPVSFLQRFSENVLYSYLLDRADECTDPIMRMQVHFIAAAASRAFCQPSDSRIVRRSICRIIGVEQQ